MPLPEHIDALSQWAVENATGRSPLDQRAFPVYPLPQILLQEHGLALRLHQDARISRASLMRAYPLADLLHEDIAKSFFVDIMRWGFGQDHRGKYRIPAMLESAVEKDFLYTYLIPLITQGDYLGVSKYLKEHHPTQCGVSFASKYAYFLSLAIGGPIFPIFDSRVAANLNGILFPDWDPVFQSTSFDSYRAYLALMREVSARTGIRPDSIELALFE